MATHAALAAPTVVNLAILSYQSLRSQDQDQDRTERLIKP
jgi:hypothetical protein